MAELDPVDEPPLEEEEHALEEEDHGELGTVVFDHPGGPEEAVLAEEVPGPEGEPAPMEVPAPPEEPEAKRRREVLERCIALRLIYGRGAT